jgi:hypothetical protein
MDDATNIEKWIERNFYNPIIGAFFVGICFGAIIHITITIL